MPVAVKLSPYFSSTGEMALRLDEAGADGLVLFNRFLQPDIDPEHAGGSARASNLSSPADGPAAADLDRAAARQGCRASLGATSGVEVPTDVARYLLAGADVVMTTSALLRHGPRIRDRAARGAGRLDVSQGIRRPRRTCAGCSRCPSEADGAAYERAGYVTAMRAANARTYNPW